MYLSHFLRSRIILSNITRSFLRHCPIPSYSTAVMTTLPVSMISNQCTQKNPRTYTYPIHHSASPHQSNYHGIVPPSKRIHPISAPRPNLLLPTRSPRCYHHKQSGAAIKRYAPPAFHRYFYVNISNSKVVHAPPFLSIPTRRLHLAPPLPPTH